MSRSDAARVGGRVAGKISNAQGRTRSLVVRAERSAEKRKAEEEATKPPAPLAPFLRGDTSGLPKAPPGRRVP